MAQSWQSPLPEFSLRQSDSNHDKGRGPQDRASFSYPETWPPGLLIGNQTCCHTAPLVPFEFALSHGFQAFEWFSDSLERNGQTLGWNEDMADQALRLELAAISRDRGIQYSVHAPHRADITTPEGMEAVQKSIAFARDIGACLVNFHLILTNGHQAFVEALVRLCGGGGRMPIPLSIENTPQTSPEDFNRLFQALNPGPIGMCLDSGHANLFPDTRGNPLAYIDRLSPQIPIIHWHGHENFGDSDTHLPLFTGPSASNPAIVTGILERLGKRGFRGMVIMEQWPEPPEQLALTASELRRMAEQR